MTSSDVVSDFEDAIRDGRFMIPKCDKCCKIVWPPADLCSICFGTISLYDQKDIKGHIIECSEYRGLPNQSTYDDNDDGFFCLVEIKNEIKIIAHLKQTDKTPKPGASITLKSCGINASDSTFFFNVELCDV